MSVHGEQSVPRPTIRDVAERAGVSKSLVSLVLRGSSKVSSDRRAAVDRAITELGYRPNAAARTLREGRSRAIGVLLNDVRHPWFFDLLDGLISVLEAEGRHVVLSGGGRLDRQMDDSVLRGFLELEVDGFILAGTQANSPVIAEIANVVPTITVGWRDIDLPRVDTVANDDLLGATLATRHLIELGHRRIAHISGRVSGASNVIGKLRQQGYQDTMRACGLGEHIRVEPGDFTEDAGYRATVRLLNSDQPPTAIFAVDDLTCLGAQSAASEMNIDVPGRLSLVGYDNSYLARLRSIWITSIDSAGFDAGRLAARTLLARVADPARAAELHLLTPTLQVRGSTAPPSLGQQLWQQLEVADQLGHLVAGPDQADGEQGQVVGVGLGEFAEIIVVYAGGLSRCGHVGGEQSTVERLLADRGELGRTSGEDRAACPGQARMPVVRCIGTAGTQQPGHRWRGGRRHADRRVDGLAGGERPVDDPHPLQLGRSGPLTGAHLIRRVPMRLTGHPVLYLIRLHTRILDVGTMQDPLSRI
jgi:DNA-binding LacI/PurR family transcriptional regulator